MISGASLQGPTALPKPRAERHDRLAHAARGPADAARRLRLPHRFATERIFSASSSRMTKLGNGS